jgi:hypothetical protein
VFEGKCLKDGLRNGGSVDWSGSARSAVHGLTAHRLIQKSPQRIFRRGPNSCDDEDMPVICPACKIILRGDCRVPGTAE